LICAKIVHFWPSSQKKCRHFDIWEQTNEVSQ
jgi:hypothetical protein